MDAFVSNIHVPVLILFVVTLVIRTRALYMENSRVMGLMGLVGAGVIGIYIVGKNCPHVS